MEDVPEATPCFPALGLWARDVFLNSLQGEFKVLTVATSGDWNSIVPLTFFFKVLQYLVFSNLLEHYAYGKVFMSS